MNIKKLVHVISIVFTLLFGAGIVINGIKVLTKHYYEEKITNLVICGICFVICLIIAITTKEKK